MSESKTRAGNTTVHVALGERSYDIHIGEGLLSRAGEIVAPFLKRPLTAIVTDAHVAEAHLATLERALSAKGIRSTAILFDATNPSDGATPSIGAPVPNARVYLLDAEGMPVPQGVAGLARQVFGAGVEVGLLTTGSGGCCCATAPSAPARDGAAAAHRCRA